MTVQLRPDGIGVLSGREIRAADGGDVRGLMIQLVVDMAAVGKTPVIAKVSEPGGAWDLVVWPDGAVTERAHTATDQVADASTTAATSSRRPVKLDEGQWYIGPVTGQPATSASEHPGTEASGHDKTEAAAGPLTLNLPAELSTGAGTLTVRTVRLSTGSHVVLPALRSDSPTGTATDELSKPPTRSDQSAWASTRPHPGDHARGLMELPWLDRGRSLVAAVRTAGLGLTGILVTVGVASLVVSNGRNNSAAQVDLPTGPMITVSRPSSPNLVSTRPSASARPTPSLLVPPSLAAAPIGFSPTPAWGLVVDPQTKVAIDGQGVVYARTSEGVLVGLRAANGAVTWTAPGTWGHEWDGPWAAHIDGRDVVALTSQTQIAYWPQPSGQSAGQLPTADPVIVTLPAQSRVTWAGPSPLIVTAAGVASVVSNGAVRAVPLPAGARALAADGTTVIATGGGQWIRGWLGHTPTVRAIPNPRGVTGSPIRVEAVSSQFLLAIWPKPAGGGQSYLLLDAKTGKVLAQRAMDRSLDATHGTVTRQLGGEMVSVGPLVVDTYRHLVRELMPQYQVRTLTEGSIIVANGGQITDIGVPVKGPLVFRTYPATYPAPNTPFAAVKTQRRIGLALVAKSDQWCLVALPESAK